MSIKDKRIEIEKKLKANDAARILIEAELKALETICEHPNPETWHDGGWGRMPSDEWECHDCGLRKSS